VQASFEHTSQDFFELASQQRLEIIFTLNKNIKKLTELASELDVTRQEVHRNLVRLEKNGFVSKEKDGYFSLTPFAKTICSQIPSIKFLSENRKYFETHDFGGVPNKFVMRIGQLSSGTNVSGVVKVLEQWKEIKSNAKDIFCEVLSEIPLDLIPTLVTQIKENPKLKCQCVLSESVIVPKGRKAMLKKLNFEELVQDGRIKRRMYKVQTVVVLNETEACVSFPDLNGKSDITQMFYGTDPAFREWCLDFFRYCWYEGSTFLENKIRD
jgi:predicted transcriptional regulator